MHVRHPNLSRCPEMCMQTLELPSSFLSRSSSFNSRHSRPSPPARSPRSRSAESASFFRPTAWPRLALVAMAALLVLGLPSLASAASSTQSFLDTDGFGAQLTIDDTSVAGSLTLSFDILSPLGAPGPVGELLSFNLDFDDNGLFPVDASGSDVFAGILESVNKPESGDPCPCILRVDLGGEGDFSPTGLQSATAVISSSERDLVLGDLAGTSIRLALLRYGPDGPDEHGQSEFVKLTANTVIPEPTTALLMLLGLTGLSLGSHRIDGRRTRRARG